MFYSVLSQPKNNKIRGKKIIVRRRKSQEKSVRNLE
jgi:hypothetical protein